MSDDVNNSNIDNFDGRSEVTGIIYFFLSLAFLLMYYLPTEITGVFGDISRKIGFGLFGVTAYIIPIFLGYVAIDYFFEKRLLVTKRRVVSILMIVVAVSSLISIFTLKFDVFKLLCLQTGSKDSFSATKALEHLWEYGVDSGKFSGSKEPTGSPVISGGFIGGVIAMSLYSVLGKIISVVFIFIFLLAQVVLVYKISLRKTAKAISKATSDVYRVVRNKTQKPTTYTTITKPDSPQVLRAPDNLASGYNLNGQLDEYNNYSNYNIYNPFEEEPINNVFVSNEVQGKHKPVTDVNGFVDVSTGGEDRNNSYDDEGKVIYYNDQKLDVTEEIDGAMANFDYTADRIYHKPSVDLNKEKPTFLMSKPEETFYDLGYDDNEAEQEIFGKELEEYENVSDMPPFELTAEDELSDYNEVEESYLAEMSDEDDYLVETSDDNLKIRKSVIDEETDANSDDITINAKDDIKGFSRTDGRIIDVDDAKPTKINYDGAIKQEKKSRRYRPAPSSLLAPDIGNISVADDKMLKAKALKLQTVIENFGIEAKVINITHGPAITRFELTIPTGTKISKITGCQNEIQYAMAAVSVRIEAPIPGKSAIGIEIPNDKTSAVYLRGLVESKEFRNSPPLEVPLGRDIPGKPIMCNLAKMPHLLIAGSTGSGKSVCINTILTSILCKSTPDDVRMILVDPKVVELQVYNGIPHLIMPVVTDATKAAATLRWAVNEMMRRYELFAQTSVRDIKGYNDRLKMHGEKALPLILIVIDELADLMLVAQKDVENSISRLAAMARAAGMHMIVATQRPTTDVLSGTIKSNIASRISFAVKSNIDSRTILDTSGAETLLGKGDMLYAPLSAMKPIRGQGAFVSDNEVEEIVEYYKKNYDADYDDEVISQVESGMPDSSSNTLDIRNSSGGETGKNKSDVDDLLSDAIDVVIDVGYASVSILQRRLGIGYPRAARLIDYMEKKNYIGPMNGSKPRTILITKTDWLEIQNRGEY